MWKKEEGQLDQPMAEHAGSATAKRPVAQSSGRATIGPSISIRGDVTGREDLLIQGEVDGSVDLADHAVGVGSDGRVNAHITGRLITIEGRVEGDLTAKEQVVLRGSAHVRGDIKAPRVVLEDGATFRGLVDMGTPDTPKAAQKRDTSSSDAAGKDEAGRATNGVADKQAATAATEKAPTTKKKPAAATAKAGSDSEGSKKASRA